MRAGRRRRAVSRGATGLALAAAAVASAIAAPRRARPESSRPATVTIAATGDVLFHGRVVDGARRHGGDTEGFARALRGLAHALEPSDLAIANLEVPLTTAVRPLAGGHLPVLGAPPELARALRQAGVDVVSMANNHAYDQGTAGIERTLRALRGAEIAAVGVGPTTEASRGAVVVRQGPTRVALLGFSEPMNRLPARRDPPFHVARLRPHARAIAAVAAARAAADLVVVSVHWSRDFVERPTRAQRALARRLVQAGADLIVGTGPHLLQEVERIQSPRGDAVVAYSLGNLISPQGYGVRYGRRGDGPAAATHPGSRDGAVLRVVFAVSESSLSLTRLEAAPLWTAHGRRRGAPHDIRVLPLGEAPPEVAATRGPEIARALGPAVALLP